MIQLVYTNMFDVLRTFGLSGAYFLLRIDFDGWKTCIVKCRLLSQHLVQENKCKTICSIKTTFSKYLKAVVKDFKECPLPGLI